MVIFRVYNVLSGDPQLKLYIDPYAMYKKNTLHFEAVGGFKVWPA